VSVSSRIATPPSALGVGTSPARPITERSLYGPRRPSPRAYGLSARASRRALVRGDAPHDTDRLRAAKHGQPAGVRPLSERHCRGRRAQITRSMSAAATPSTTRSVERRLRAHVRATPQRGEPLWRQARSTVADSQRSDRHGSPAPLGQIHDGTPAITAASMGCTPCVLQIGNGT